MLGSRLTVTASVWRALQEVFSQRIVGLGLISRRFSRQILAASVVSMGVLLAACVSNQLKERPSGTESLIGTWLMQPHSPAGIATVDTVTFRATTSGVTGVWNDWNSGRSTDFHLTEIHVEGQSISFRVIYKGQGSQNWRGRFGDVGQLELKPLAEDGTPDESRVVFRRTSAAEVRKLKAQVPKVFTGKPPLPELSDLPSNHLAPTPIMGWNSWNHLRESVDDQSIREIADAIVGSGLRDAGYIYVDIDDGWQGRRDPQGTMHPNEKFPDMKALADYVHSKGLKFGIYNSPGPLSCAGYVGSYGHEAQDARTFAAWGVDLLKYDWCSAGELYTTQAQMQAVYQKMGKALHATGRPIVYSLCQYGLFDVGSWGRKVGGNLWRTGGDTVIGARWTSTSVRFDTDGNPEVNGPGGWNDPDMLLIGNGGMTTDEYRTHMTLWAMLAAPLIIGNDVRTMTPEVASILLNQDVISVDQDQLGQQGRRILKRDAVEVWIKPLSDGSTAVAVFNRGTDIAKVDVNWVEIGLSERERTRDLWTKTDLGELVAGYAATVVPHGSVLLKVMTIY
jgi:alpha-galactosidase